MRLFEIETDKCTGNGICAKECPAKIILIQNGIPVPGVSAENLCIRCGHCVSICPTGAFSLTDLSPDDCLPIRKEELPGPDTIKHFLQSRRSIRNFKEEPIEKPVLEKIFQMTSHAPSGHNSQPVRWHVIYDRKRVHELSTLVIDWMMNTLTENKKLARTLYLELVVAGWQYGYDTISREAPHLILACGDRSNLWAREACLIAMSHLELGLMAYQLGGCWSGYFRRAFASWQPLREAIGLPPDLDVHGVMLAGRPAFDYKRIPPRKEPAVFWK